MKIEVLFFAAAREVVGTSSLLVDLPDGATIADLRHQLGRDFPSLANVLTVTRFSIGTEYARDDEKICPGSRVACIPPVSGG